MRRRLRLSRWQLGGRMLHLTLSTWRRRCNRLCQSRSPHLCCGKGGKGWRTRYSSDGAGRRRGDASIAHIRSFWCPRPRPGAVVGAKGEVVLVTPTIHSAASFATFLGIHDSVRAHGGFCSYGHFRARIHFVLAFLPNTGNVATPHFFLLPRDGSIDDILPRPPFPSFDFVRLGEGRDGREYPSPEAEDSSRGLISRGRGGSSLVLVVRGHVLLLWRR